MKILFFLLFAVLVGGNSYSAANEETSKLTVGKMIKTSCGSWEDFSLSAPIPDENLGRAVKIYLPRATAAEIELLGKHLGGQTNNLTQLSLKIEDSLQVPFVLKSVFSLFETTSNLHFLEIIHFVEDPSIGPIHQKAYEGQACYKCTCQDCKGCCWTFAQAMEHYFPEIKLKFSLQFKNETEILF